MKKLFAILLAGMLAFGAAACGQTQPTEEAEQVLMPEDMTAMAAPIDSLARCMLENDLTYTPDDPEFFWTALYYFTGGYAMGHAAVEMTEDAQIKVPRQVMQEHATALFADYDDLLELPADMQGRISYDESVDAYLVMPGDIGLSETKLTNFGKIADGYVLTAELWSMDEDANLIAVWDVTLVDNAYADGISEPTYHYSVSDMTRVTEDTEVTEVTAIFNGLSDSHTAEFTMNDGTVQTFQFDGDSAIADALSALQEGDGLSFRYDAGAMRITAVGE